MLLEPIVRFLVFLLVSGPLSACGEGAIRTQPDGGSDAGAVDEISEDDFWKRFEIDGEWTEFYPTMEVMAGAADLIVLADVRALARGATLRGDQQEDISAELVLELDELTHIRGENVPDVRVTLTYAHSAPSNAEVQDLADSVPRDRVLFLLRKRQSGAFRPVNGHGLWVRTRRAHLDAPLNACLPSEGPYSQYVEQYETVEALGASLN